MTAGIALDAPAKLNLDLTVVGRRDDGYHLLDSVMVLLEVADRVTLVPGTSGLRVEGPEAQDLPVDASNLAWRGFMASAARQSRDAHVALDKRIPSGGGLGGGSSDAAAAWRLGRAWHGLGDVPPPSEIAALAAVGADVPFFASRAAAARVHGIGERVEMLSPLSLEVVLAHPAFSLSTAAVFSDLRPDEWGRLPNDLLAPARRLCPRIDELMALVAAAGGAPRLTGSGPTIFATTDDAERAAAICARLRRAGVRTTLTRTRSAAASIETLRQEE